MQLFYDTSLDTSLTIGSPIKLGTELSHHMIVVLRRSVGDSVSICNGAGWLYECSIVSASKRECELIIESVEQNWGRQCEATIKLAIAPTKSVDRLEWAVEKAVEIGASSIVPIMTQRTERKSVNAERLRRVARSAAEQSLKGNLPVVEEMQKFKDFVAQNPNGFIAHCNEGQKISIPVGQSSYTILIGPEGDFSPAEVELALSYGYRAVTLGRQRFRTETAALCALYHCTL